MDMGRRARDGDDGEALVWPLDETSRGSYFLALHVQSQGWMPTCRTPTRRWRDSASGDGQQTSARLLRAARWCGGTEGALVWMARTASGACSRRGCHAVGGSGSRRRLYCRSRNPTPANSAVLCASLRQRAPCTDRLYFLKVVRFGRDWAANGQSGPRHLCVPLGLPTCSRRPHLPRWTCAYVRVCPADRQLHPRDGVSCAPANVQSSGDACGYTLAAATRHRRAARHPDGSGRGRRADTCRRREGRAPARARGDRRSSVKSSRKAKKFATPFALHRSFCRSGPPRRAAPIAAARPGLRLRACE